MSLHPQKQLATTTPKKTLEQRLADLGIKNGRMEDPNTGKGTIEAFGTTKEDAENLFVDKAKSHKVTYVDITSINYSEVETARGIRQKVTGVAYKPIPKV